MTVAKSPSDCRSVNNFLRDLRRATSFSVPAPESKKSTSFFR